MENLRLEDSVFTSSAQYLGSIAGKCMGTLSNIYSEAVVENNQGRIGGLVGYSSGTAAILEKCWFAGTVRNTATSAASVGQKGGTGGLIGVVDNSSSGALMLRNCLNAGAVDVSAYTGEALYAGGLIGWVQNQTAVTVESCLMSGSMPKGESANQSYGPIAGNVRLEAGGVAQSTIFISRTYAVDSVESLQGTKVTSDSFEYVSASSITGSAAQTNMPLLGWGTDWKTVTGSFPELDFSQSAAAVSLAASSSDTEALDELYKDRTLYQGELHDHADTSVGSNAGTSDGYVEITKWYSQMSTKGLDFAASLDHKQASHIDLDIWDESKLIYGSEAGANSIPNKSDPSTTNKHHYSMLFRTKAQFEEVLNAFQGFCYGKNNGNAYWENRGNNGAIEFTYWNPTTRDQFADLIRAVQNADGFFVLPHALNTSEYNSGLAEDYDFGVDGVGFEVIYDGGTGHSVDDRLYEAWKELLAGDAKMYACAGTDNHRNLDNTCLTSIYGTSDAKTDKGYLIDQLRAGDFVAGSAGIKMCVGGTAMGGTCDFSGKRVVVQVDRIHTLANDLSHKYRIDIISEDGVVYSQPLTVNSTTGEVNATFAFDADNSSSFYRVVVMDCTTRTRIAIGNPIWNS